MSERQEIVERLASKDYRDGLVEAEIGNNIAFQLKAMLRERGWTQQQLAEYAKTAQPLISKYLSGYEQYSLQTLKNLASGFDVGLIVSFAPFSEIVDRYVGRSYASIAIPSYDSDRRLHEPSSLIGGTADQHVERFDLTAHQLPVVNHSTWPVVYLDQIRQERSAMLSTTTNSEGIYAKASA
jgi:transcriptional regulator with XRE-family HTH domain